MTALLVKKGPLSAGFQEELLFRVGFFVPTAVQAQRSFGDAQKV